MRQIYLDYNATTPLAPSVLEVMQPFFTGHYGNPSSPHSLGRGAREAIEDARAKVANAFVCDADEIIFTGGGTESNNLAIKGVMFQYKPDDAHLIISAIEHPAVSEPANFLKRLGYGVSVVPCDENGVVSPDAVEAAIQPNTRLVSIMHANNEIGTVQPISAIADLCAPKNILVHTDASQSVGKLPTQVDVIGVDMLTVAAHKFYGPKGIGALYVRRGIALESLLHGAGHENGFRAGTENTASIVGLGQASILASKALEDSAEGMTRLRDRLGEQLIDAIPDLYINGGAVDRLPNTLSVSFPGISGREILGRATEICASTGSACHSTGKVESATLAAMGKSHEHVAGTVRLSLGWYSSQEDIDRAASLLIDAWEVLTETPVQ